MHIVVVLLLLPQLSFGDLVLNTVDSMLDPSPLTWWRTQWTPGAIQLSANNKASTQVTVTFRFSPTTALVSGVLEVLFPAGFGLLSLPTNRQTATGQVVQVSGLTLGGGQDYSVSVMGVTNPSSAGAYGPFALRTRYNAGGQQVDVNLLFASVYISEEASSLTGLTVTFAGTVQNAVNKSGNTLSFKFNLAVALWRYDTFTVVMDLAWTIGAGVACTSADYAGKINNFNGTSQSSPHSLQCMATSKTSDGQTAYIYGLSTDDINPASNPDDKFVDLRISPVTTPSQVQPGSPYTWTVKVMRFGTGTVLASGAVSGTPAIVPDVITSATWIPTWGTAASDLTSGSAYFMDLSFSLSNPVPLNGAIQILVTEDLSQGDAKWTGNAALNCYLVSNLGSSVACTITPPSTLTLTNLPAMSASTTVKLRNVVKLLSGPGMTASVTSISTFAGTVTRGVLIDQGLKLGAFQVSASSAVSIAAFGVVFQDSTSTSSDVNADAGGNGSYRQGIQFIVVPSPISDITSASNFAISCPFTTSLSDFSIGVPSSSFLFKDSASAVAEYMVTALSPLTANLPILTPGTSSSAGSLVFSGAIGTVSSGLHLLLSQPGSSTSFITLPRVSNNLATAYECRVTVTTSGKTTHRGAVRFIVEPQEWTTKTFALPCSTQIEGIPGTFTLLPAVLPVPDSSPTATYYVEIDFDGTVGFNAGLSPTSVNTPNQEDVMSFAVPYPLDRLGTETLTGSMYTNGVTTFVAVTGFIGLLPTSTARTIFFPLGGLALGAVTPTIRSYYILGSDRRYKYITHESDTNTLTLTSPGTPTAFAAALVISSALVSGETLSSKLYVNLPASNLLPTEHYLFFILPPGFAWSSTASVLNVGASETQYTNVRFISSPTQKFKYPLALVNSVIGTTNTPLSIVSNPTGGTVALTGIKAGLGSGSLSLQAALGDVLTTDPCPHYSPLLPLATAAGSVSSISVSPTTSKSRGPDGVATKHSVSFTLQHGVPLGGSIALTMASDWDVTVFTNCSASGLQPAPGGTMRCLMAARRATVTGFADFSSSPGSSIVVSFSGLLAPVSASGASSTAFLTALTSSTDSSISDSATVLTGSGVTVTASSSIGRSTWQKKTTIPQTAGAKDVDLYLRFLLPHAIPRYGIILLSSPLAFKLTSTINNKCFFSPVQYSDCSMGGTNGASVQITLDQDVPAGTVFELYLDSAVDNPTSTSSTSTGFTSKSSWGGVTIDADTGSIQSSQTFTASALPAAKLVLTSFSISPTNAGEKATYYFAFNDTVKLSAGDQYVVQFPSQYDYLVGDVRQYFTNEPNIYYLNCSSAELGRTWCAADHRRVILKGSNVIALDNSTNMTSISFTLDGVVNPGPGPTGQFQLYHLDTNGNYKAVNQKLTTATITALATNLDVRALKQSDRRLFKPSNFVWSLILADTLTAASLLKTLFPAEFDLKGSSYSCISTWSDQTSALAKNWNAALQCPTAGNWVWLPPPSAAITFTSTAQVSWSIEGVPNPQWGRNRTALNPTQDFEVTDPVLWPLDPQWSGKFQFFVYQNSSTNFYSSRSYDNLHAGYASFQQPNRALWVNFYDPFSKSNRIVVSAGSQTTDLLISTADSNQPLAAKMIEFSPATSTSTPDSGKLTYTSTSTNWKLSQGKWSIPFRIGAAIDMSKGLFYIDWTITETKEAGRSENQYDPPVSTLVEVQAKTSAKFMFSVSSVPTLTTGYSSVPIRLAVPNSPHSDVTVNVAVQGSPANITVGPSPSFKFLPDVNKLHFQIQIASGYDAVAFPQQNLLFALTGTDAYSYKIPASMKINIVPNTTVIAPGNIQNWGLGSTTRTTVSIAPITDQAGTIYYILGAAGMAVPSFSALRTAVISQNATEYTVPEIEPKVGESWVSFQRRLYREHLGSTWINSINMTTSISDSIVFNWLYAGTTYQLSGYLDTQAKTDPAVATVTFQTKPQPDCQPFEIKFTGYAPRAFNFSVTPQVAQVIGVNPLRLFNTGYSSVRRLQDNPNALFSTFLYTLVPDRSWEAPTPAEQVKFSDTQMAALAANLRSNGVANNISSIVKGVVPGRNNPIWATDPAVLSSTDSSISISLRASIAGETCCIPLTSTTAPTSEQVLLGLDASNESVNSTCLASDLNADVNTVVMAGLQAKTQYSVYCIATDNYPLWPSLPATPTYLSATTAAPPSVPEPALACLLSMLALLLPLL